MKWNIKFDMDNLNEELADQLLLPMHFGAFVFVQKNITQSKCKVKRINFAKVQKGFFLYFYKKLILI